MISRYVMLPQERQLAATATQLVKNNGTEQHHTASLPLTTSVDKHTFCERREETPIQFQINPPVQYVAGQ